MRNSGFRISDSLKNLRINKTLDVSGISVTATASILGCKGCAFMPRTGGDGCGFRNSCLAHKRPDRMSVIFKLVKK